MTVLAFSFLLLTRVSFFRVSQLTPHPLVFHLLTRLVIPLQVFRTQPNFVVWATY